MATPFVVVDDAGAADKALLYFSQPLSVVSAHSISEIAPAFDAIEGALKNGNHVSGYLSYELGYALEPRLWPLLPSACSAPLLWLGIFGPPQECSTNALPNNGSTSRAYAGPLEHEWNAGNYGERFERVHALIEAGDVYQANLSFRSQFHFVGDALQLYRSLHASAAASHCAYVDDGQRQILSLSPELFFKISAEGLITARPMKGTAARGTDSFDDAAARTRLRESPKERAENLMIVDLLRNDLGRIAEVGSVAVNDLFAVETYPTLHQMVSTVTAKLRPSASASEIIRALFPCGSITGAPKIRAMEILHGLEASPRGAYCGAVGYFAPDGAASFNVAIRTITIAGDRGDLGIGGGVVYDSRANAEYAECLLKARYFESVRRPIELIETLRWSPSGRFTRLQYHLRRMADSAQTFGIAFSHQSAMAALMEVVSDGELPLRVRLALSEDGTFGCSAVPLSHGPRSWRCSFSSIHVSSRDVFLRHKTSWREMFEDEHARAKARGYDEVIFTNENGAITEGSRSNVFAWLDGKLVTPPLACGLLNGCLRQEMLDAEQCVEGVLFPSDLNLADRVLVGNSLRGLLDAQID